MKINRDNYEQFFLDHAEGSLSPEMEKELELFLATNPDLKDILENFDATPLPVEELENNTLKTRLKKNIHPTAHIHENNTEEWLIREIEGLLSDDETTELALFLKNNPAYEYDRKIYGLTRISADKKIRFPEKDLLKKKAPILSFRSITWIAVSAAAMVLLFFGIRFLDRPQLPVQPEIVQTVSKPEVKTQVAEQVQNGTPSQTGGTPSQTDGTPSHFEKITPVRITRMEMASIDVPKKAQAENLALAYSKQIGRAHV